MMQSFAKLVISALLQRGDAAYRASTAVFVILCLTFGSAHSVHADNAGPIRVTLDDNYPPYIFRNGDGALDGYLVDIWKAWERHTGIKVVLTATDWSKAQEVMDQGNADVIDTVFRTPARESKYDFTAPYADIPVSLFAHGSIGGIAGTDTLHGFLVGVKAGDACIDHLREVGITTLQPFDSYQRLAEAAADGRVKVFCLDDPPANYLLYRFGIHGQFRHAFTLFNGRFHRAVHKGDIQTLNLVERGFSAITEQERQALHDKWFGTPIDVGFYGQYLWDALIIALAVGGIVSVWLILLRREVRRRTRELAGERARLRTLLDALPDLVWLKDANGTYLACNAGVERVFGAAESAIVGKTDYDFVSRDVADTFRCKDSEVIASEGINTYVQEVVYVDGSRRMMLETIKAPMFDGVGQFVGVLGIGRDVTERMRQEAALDHLAHHDVLTGLPNRAQLLDRLTSAIKVSSSESMELAVLFVDLDGFKHINDSLGHSIGDKLLCVAAETMRMNLDKDQLVARLGGDEFVILIERNASEATATIVAAGLNEIFTHPLLLDGRAFFMTASIGISMFPRDGMDADTLLKHADLAMYQAKEVGRNTSRFFVAELGETAGRRLAISSALRGVLQRDELFLVYQPQILLFDGSLVGVEALIRWNSPDFGMVPPDEFIPIAEENGAIREIGAWVLSQSCRQIAAWEHQGFWIPRIAVNLSVQQIEHNNLTDMIDKLLSEFKLTPDRLELEVTETLAMRSSPWLTKTLDELKLHGICLVIDDFGTGHSSLMRLKQLPVQRLKIDRSFVRDMVSDPNDEAIVRAIITLGHSLKLEIVAEGVEDQQQSAYLQAYGCEMAQGYHYGRPMTAESLFTTWSNRTGRL